MQLHDELRNAGAFIVTTEKGRFSTMTVALFNGVMSVYHTKTDEEGDDNQLTVSNTRKLQLRYIRSLFTFFRDVFKSAVRL